LPASADGPWAVEPASPATRDKTRERASAMDAWISKLHTTSASNQRLGTAGSLTPSGGCAPVRQARPPGPRRSSCSLVLVRHR
jgi:hypothetical protein